MSKLAVLLQWAFTTFEVVLAELSLVLLFQSMDLALVAIEVLVIRLLGKLSHDLAWWIVEVPWSAIGV